MKINVADVIAEWRAFSDQYTFVSTLLKKFRGESQALKELRKFVNSLSPKTELLSTEQTANLLKLLINFIAYDTAEEKLYQRLRGLFVEEAVFNCLKILQKTRFWDSFISVIIEHQNPLSAAKYVVYLLQINGEPAEISLGLKAVNPYFSITERLEKEKLLKLANHLKLPSESLPLNKQKINQLEQINKVMREKNMAAGSLNIREIADHANPLEMFEAELALSILNNLGKKEEVINQLKKLEHPYHYAKAIIDLHKFNILNEINKEKVLDTKMPRQKAQALIAQKVKERLQQKPLFSYWKLRFNLFLCHKFCDPIEKMDKRILETSTKKPGF